MKFKKKSCINFQFSVSQGFILCVWFFELEMYFFPYWQEQEQVRFEGTCQYQMSILYLAFSCLELD